MYVLVRQDLGAGYQIPQAIHAKDKFSHEHAKIEHSWYEESNTIAVLGVDNEEHLLGITQHINELGLKFSLFFEPDIQEYTSVAIEPGDKTSEILKVLKRACGGKRKRNRK